jgi:glycerophosphoryl diester phosphodiesterase
MILNSSTPVVFAHRGASAHAPENTLSAFKLAREQGAQAIELDVQLTADEEIVVFHDATVDRITNSTGKIRDYILSELKKLNAGFAYGPAFQDERIPTLSEVFTEFNDFPLINIELKNLETPLDNLPQKVSDLVADFDMSKQVLISSFNSVALKRFNNINPDIPLGILIHSPLTLDTQRFFIPRLDRYRSVHLSSQALNQKRVNFIHSHNKLVFSYTINHPDEMIQSLSLGVDGFFTDDPGLALRTLADQDRIVHTG